MKVVKYYHPDEFAELKELHLKKDSATANPVRLSALHTMRMNRSVPLQKQSIF